VMASLPNQRFLARIAGKLFNIELPIIVQPGETLQLTYVTGEPHTTFTLSRKGNSATPVAISDTGRLLNQLSMNGADPRQAGGVTRSSAILNGPPADTSLFASLLGERQARELLKEPQGKLSSRGKFLAEGNPTQKSGADGADGIAQEALSDELIATDRSSAPVDPRTVPIVQEQLQTLHTGQVVWHGEVWPRQEMEWSIREEKHTNGEGIEKSWVSTLRLELPNLGGVAATLRLEKEGISIHIDADRESASAIMQMEQEPLAQAMSDVGIKLLSVAIEHEEHGK